MNNGLDLIFFATPETGSFIVDIISWVVKFSSSIALGVILFTILLKLITLPFDIISKVQTRKNSLIMEKMRPDLEKLQKQYAHDKQLYQQKMMALYKKNGYSMMGACLPTIVTLVIFIVAINAFTNYSQFRNRNYFYEMSLAYNTSVYNGIEVDGDLVKKEIVVEGEDGLYKLVFDNEKIISKDNGEFTSNGVTYTINKGVHEQGGSYYEISSASGYVSFRHYFVEGQVSNDNQSGEYSFNIDKLKANTELKLKDGKNFNDFILANQGTDENVLGKTFIQRLGSEYSANQYRAKEDERRFLWVKNIWAIDSPFSSPIEKTWDRDTEFKGCGCSSEGNGFKANQKYEPIDGEFENMSATNYNLLIADLGEEIDQTNGYFILSVLTAVISFVSQLVISKSQKAQMELQTVDGQGANTQKMMMWMMPLMMVFFSFLYTATFSIYMILSQLLSIASTFGINFFVDRKFKKQESKENNEKIRGRVYVKKEEEIKEDKKSKKAKKEKEETPDFINGGAKYLRGRKK